jgi:hypothetical protein
MVRSRLAVLVAAALLSPVAQPPATAAGCAVKGQVTARGGGWTTIRYPTFRERPDDVSRLLGTTYPFPNEGGQNVISVATDRWNPKVLYVTNGKVLLRSADGGCTWQETFSLWEATTLQPPAGARPDTTGSTITRVVTPDGKSAHARTFLVIVDRPSGRVVVARSANGVDGWAFTTLNANDQHPASAWDVALVASRKNPDVMYLGVAARSYAKIYYRSADGGKTWALKALDDTGDYRHEGNLYLAVNPLDENELWEGDCGECGDPSAYGDFRHSRDGAATWQRLAVGNPNASYVQQVLAVVPRGTKKARVYALYQSRFGYRSDDGGKTYDRFAAIDGAGQMMEGSNPGDLVVGGGGNTLRILSEAKVKAKAKNPWINVSGRYKVPEATGGAEDKDRWMVAAAAWTVTPRRVFFLPTTHTLERYEGQA